jgi:prepilin-type N-terminal cleavage/methylation domain-containing protein
MLQRIRKARHEESGFTLIELLIVIVILGILAAVVVFAVNGITNKGQNAACKADVQSVTTAAEAAYAQTGTYPASVALLVSGGFLHSAPTGETITYVVSAGPPASVAVSSTSCP